MVFSQPLSQAELTRYEEYSLRFYAWTHHQTLATMPHCQDARFRQMCQILQQQVTSRLVQERVVLHYAHEHHINPTTADTSTVDRHMEALAAPRAGTANLFTDMKIDPAFMRAVLEREMLVQRVEEAVAPASTRSGVTFHVRQYYLPLHPGVSDSERARQAVTLATYGHPIPPATYVREQWKAPFRVSRDERDILDSAQPGDFVGPFFRNKVYEVTQFLGKEKHAYGVPARQELEAAFFQKWLNHQISDVHPVCFSARGKSQPCLTIMKRM